jgi:hypothetical protein
VEKAVSDGDRVLQAKFPDWPSKPKMLHVYDVANILALLGDAVMLLLALAFAGSCLLIRASGLESFDFYRLEHLMTTSAFAFRTTHFPFI